MTENPATPATPATSPSPRPTAPEPMTSGPAAPEPTASPEPTVRWSHPAGQRTEHLLVLLHGYGANEDDLFGLVPQLPAEFTVAAVRAPLAMGMGAFAWFPLSQDPVTGEIGSDDAPAVRRAIADLHAWVASVRGDFRTVSLLGFSQGMALATSLLRIEPAAYTCTVGLSGFVVDPEGAEPELVGLFQADDDVAAVKPRVFWGRGQDDPIISEARVEAAHAWLNANTDLMKIVYAGLPHAINPQEIGHVREYLQHMVLKGA